jgi:hypothetical protein
MLALIPYLFLYLLVIIGIFLFGYIYTSLCFPLVHNQIKEDCFKVVSFSLTIGFIFITSILAVYFTHCDTIFLWPFVILMIPFFRIKGFNFKAQFQFKKILSPKKIMVVASIALSVFFYNVLLFYRSNGYLFWDLTFYSKIAKGLIEYGYESPYVIYGEYFDAPKQILYHYGDLWLTGILPKIIDLSVTNCLVYVTYPFLHFSILMLMISLFTKNNKNSIWYILLGISLLYGSKLFLHINSNNEFFEIIQTYRGFLFSIFYCKLLPIYLLIIFAVLLYKNSYSKYCFIVLSFVPIFYSTTIPVLAGIGVAMFLFSIISIKIKIKDWDIHFYNPLFILASITFILFFSIIRPFDTALALPYYIYPIKTYIVFFYETFIKVFGEHFIILFIFIFFVIKSKGQVLIRPLVFFSMMGLLSGYLFVYIHSPGIQDLNQILTNISPILVLVIAIDLFPFIEEKYLKTIVVVMCLFSISNLSYFHFYPDKGNLDTNPKMVSNDFYQEMNQYYNNYNGQIIASSISNVTGDERWICTYNKPQQLFIPNKINIPLEIGFLFTKHTLLNYGKHPYYTLFKDSLVTDERILFFLKNKKVSHLYIEDYTKLPTNFISNFKLLYEDEKTKLSFWESKILN